MKFYIMLLLLCLAKPATASANTTGRHTGLNAAVMSETQIIQEILDADEDARNEQLCLALNIYHEVRGGAERDRWAVGFVTMNRVERGIWGPTVCSVVWARSQFSWTVRSIRSLMPREAGAWEDAQRKAHMLYMGQRTEDPTDGCTHFYANRLRPDWSRRLVGHQRIGGHTFARLPSRSAR